MTTPAVVLATDLLATYRLTRLVQRDHFPPVVAARDAVLRPGKDDQAPGWAFELLQDCPWCLSFWVGLIVVTARRIAPRLWSPIAMGLAASAITGLATQYELLAHAETEHA